MRSISHLYITFTDKIDSNITIASAKESTINMTKKVALSQLKRMPQPNIGLLIKQLRQEMELTQEEFASECGVFFNG